MDVEATLRSRGIAAKLRGGPQLGGLASHVITAPDAATRDRWIDQLAGADGLYAVALLGDASDLERPDGWEGDDATEVLARATEVLARLDRWRAEPAVMSGPDRLAALRAWDARAQAARGAPLASLVEAIRAAPVAPYTVLQREPAASPETLAPEPPPADLDLLLVPARAGHEVLAIVGFGHYNACPPTAEHVAHARRWERDLDAHLVALGRDSYTFRIGRLPAPGDERALARAEEKLSGLGADERTASDAPEWWCWWD